MREMESSAESPNLQKYVKIPTRKGKSLRMMSEDGALSSSTSTRVKSSAKEPIERGRKYRGARDKRTLRD